MDDLQKALELALAHHRQLKELVLEVDQLSRGQADLVAAVDGHHAALAARNRAFLEPLAMCSSSPPTKLDEAGRAASSLK